MNPNEQKLHYPWGETLPASGTAIDVAEGIRWVRLPLPFALDHVNVWLVRDQIDGQDGWTVIDCGVARPEVQAVWEQVFAQALDGLAVLRVLVTHMHPDHVGLAHWICTRWQAPLWMTMSDYAVARLWSCGADKASEGGAGGDDAVAHFARHGLADPEALDAIRQRHDYYPALVPAMPDTFVRILDGDTINIGGDDWRVIVGYGHAPEHASLLSAARGVLIAGDMVLPRISTNVSVFAHEPLANPLPLYLRSLDAYANLAADTLVLPSHGRPFRGLHERIAQQHAHHAARLAEVLQACTPAAQSAADIIPVLFHRKLDFHQLTFAMGESLAHLHALYFDGTLRREIEPDGVVRFFAA